MHPFETYLSCPKLADVVESELGGGAVVVWAQDRRLAARAAFVRTLLERARQETDGSAEVGIVLNHLDDLGQLETALSSDTLTGVREGGWILELAWLPWSIGDFFWSPASRLRTRALAAARPGVFAARELGRIQQYVPVDASRWLVTLGRKAGPIDRNCA